MTLRHHIKAFYIFYRTMEIKFLIALPMALSDIEIRHKIVKHKALTLNSENEHRKCSTLFFIFIHFLNITFLDLFLCVEHSFHYYT